MGPTGKGGRGRHAAAARGGAAVIVVTAVLAVALATAPAPPSPRADEAAFVAEVEDLPLMPGLVEAPDAGVVFDKPSGRIVEAYAEGAVTRAAVTAFYARTLPQLGWRALDRTRYAREGEHLEIFFLGSDGDLVVRFTLQPE